MDTLFQPQFKRIPGLTPPVVDFLLQADVATDGSNEVEAVITIPSGLTSSMLGVFVAATRPLVALTDPAIGSFALRAEETVADDTATLYGYAYAASAATAAEHTLTLEFEGECTPVVALVLLSNVQAGSAVGRSLDAEQALGIELSLVEIDPLDHYAACIDLIVSSGDVTFTPMRGQAPIGDPEGDELFARLSYKGDLNRNVSQFIGWRLSAAADRVMQLALVVQTASEEIQAPEDVELVSFWPMDAANGASEPDTANALSNGAWTNPERGLETIAVGGAGSTGLNGADSRAVFPHVGPTVGSARHWQHQAMTFGGYCQIDAHPAAGTQFSVASKDADLPPGGWSVEVRRNAGDTTTRLRAHSRNAAGGVGSATFVNAASDGVVDVTPGVAFKWALVFDPAHPTQPVRLLFEEDGGSASVVGFSTVTQGQQDNTRSLYMGTDHNGAAAMPGVLKDGLVYRGALSLAAFAALPAPASITHSTPDIEVTVSNIVLGNLAPGSVTDVDIAPFATGLAGGDLDLTEISDPAGRATFVGDGTAGALIRIIMPGTAPGSNTDESATFTVSENAGPASNVFQVSWTRLAAPTGGFTPFPFVTVSNPIVSHAGVADRPGFSPSDPRTASIIDPMSGIEIFRVGGNAGANIFAYQTGSAVDSGFDFPARLRNENSPRNGNVWNADSTLLMIARRFDTSGDPGGNLAGSYLIDVTGQYTGGPWRIIRAAGGPGLGEAGQWWFWDPLIPTRAYIITNAGAIQEWWPVGGSGHSVGEINTLYGARAGFGSHNQGRRHMIACSWDGQWYVTGCRETGGDQRWGGYRINLLTGAFGPFIPDSFPGFPNSTDSNHSTQGTSATGLYTTFQRNGNHHRCFRTSDGQFMSDTGANAMSHIEMTIINGVEYLVGGHSTSTGFRLWNIADGGFTTKASIPMNNPQHTGCLNTIDAFQTHGAAGGGTSGQRYAIFTKSNDQGGHSRGIMGIRLGPDDNNQIRYLLNHRSIRTTNGNEVHPQVSPNGRYIVFPSNWAQPGVATDGHVHPYVAVIPDAWWSPNNDGS